MYKRKFFILFVFVLFFCGRNFGIGGFDAGVVSGNDIFSSPIIERLPSEFYDEDSNSTKNTGINDNKNQSKNQNTNKLRPRYNVVPSLGDRIELVSAQTEKSIPSPPAIVNAEYLEAQSGKTPFADTQNNNNHESNSPQNLTGFLPQYDLSNLSYTNSLVPNYSSNSDLTPSMEIPQLVGCDSNSVSQYFDNMLNDSLRQYQSKKNIGWFFDGFVDAGIFVNNDSPDSKINSIIEYNDQDREFVMNQLYLSLGRKIPARSNQIEFGGQIDLLFGTDYFYTSAVGLETRRTYYQWDVNTIYPELAVPHWNAAHGARRNNTAALYGLSLPQAFGEIYLPYGYGMTLKAGHFYANMGIESAAATRNFFYTHSYNFMYGQPNTLTGGLLSIKLAQTRSIIFGLTQGWDMFDKQGDLNITTGFKIHSRDELNSFSFILMSGKQSDTNTNNRTNYTLAINRKLSQRWYYSLEHSFGYEKNGATKSSYYGVNTYMPSKWLSIAQYLKYDINKNLSFGIRAEWFRDDGLARIQGTPVDMLTFYYTGKNYYELTFGLNWRPSQNITIRPEVRFDWSDVKLNWNPLFAQPPSGVYNNQNNRTAFAIDAIITF
ncbi:MAG: porin [Planctomycetaceae bacterium]|jgi:hypothetical protein|nr:porin [Planctomycetaceae bacterium]